MSIAVLILGIASIVCGICGFGWFPGLVCAIIALVLHKKAVAKDGINSKNKVGKILAIIGLIVSILGLVGCIACVGCYGTALAGEIAYYGW